jgi:hypothetical protein
MGSPGGNSSYSSDGRGGGKIFIIADKADIHGTIAANGSGGGGQFYGGGGGSGGEIFIQCEKIDFTGSISANGGKGGDGDFGGGGGGGRIKIIYDTGFAIELLSQIQANRGTGYNNSKRG